MIGPHPLSPEELANVNKPAVQRLVDGLRSGKYQQGKRFLITIGDGEGDTDLKFCCLGVACILAKDYLSLDFAVEVDTSKVHLVPRIIVRDGTGSSSASLLPGEVIKFYGFRDDNPILAVDHHMAEMTNATIANDDLDMTFPQIADAFERTYLPGEPS